MSKKTNPPRKKLTPVTVGLTAALITAVAGIAAALIQTYGHSEPATESGATQAAVPYDASSAPGPGHSPSPAPRAGSPVNATRPETAEFAAPVFANYAGPAGIEGSVSPGQVVHVACRIPGDSTTPDSDGEAGWYRIRKTDSSTAYVAANFFYNDPHSGYGMQPNHTSFDAAVPVC
jgi:hypothetical protein